MRGKNRAFGRGVSRHWGNFLQLQAGHEHWRWRNAAPAVELPMGAKEFDLRAEGDVEDHLGGAAIELLRELKKRALAEILAVGGTPEGDVEGLLLDLLGDREGAKEGAGNSFGDVERRAVTVRFEPGVGRDERKFEGHDAVPVLSLESLSQQKDCGGCQRGRFAKRSPQKAVPPNATSTSRTAAMRGEERGGLRRRLGFLLFCRR